jgi:DNA-binding NarL/FixJ family response regulator
VIGDRLDPIRSHCAKIVYYNSDHSHSVECTAAVSQKFNATWTLPSTWQELVAELEQGCEFLIFHESLISTSAHSTAIEFIDAINTIVRFIPSSTGLKIGVIVKPTTSLSTIRLLQKTNIQGILLDINHYSLDEVQIGVNALINRIPYWPKHIISKLPGNTRKVIKPTEIYLTPRQDQIFRMIKERGASNKAIAKSLGISESTVKLHITQIFKKYGVRNRTQLAVLSP